MTLRLALPSWRTSLKILAGVLLVLSCAFAAVVLYVVSQFGGTAMFPADCAVVFGTAVRPSYDAHGHIVYTGPGPGILRRAGTAAALYRAGKVRKVFLTGGTGEGMAESEAEVMRRVSVVGGVALKDMVMESRSHSTRENLQNTRPLAGECRSVVAISDRYHLARIAFLAWKMGWNVQTYPASPHADRAFEASSVVREALGIILASVNFYSR